MATTIIGSRSGNESPQKTQSSQKVTEPWKLKNGDDAENARVSAKSNRWGSGLGLLAYGFEGVFEFLDLLGDDDAAVALAGIEGEVVPVVVLGGVEFLEGNDLGDNGIVPLFLGFFLGGFGEGFFLVVVVEDDGAILCTAIIALLIQSGGIVGGPEEIDNFLVADFGGIVVDLNDLGVAGGLGADFLIGRVFLMTACESADDPGDAVLHLELRFGTPETTAAQGGDGGFCGAWVRFIGGRGGGSGEGGGHGGDGEGGKAIHGWWLSQALGLGEASENTCEATMEPMQGGVKNEGSHSLRFSTCWRSDRSQ